MDHSSLPPSVSHCILQGFSESRDIDLSRDFHKYQTAISEMLYDPRGPLGFLSTALGKLQRWGEIKFETFIQYGIQFAEVEHSSGCSPILYSKYIALCNGRLVHLWITLLAS